MRRYPGLRYPAGPHPDVANPADGIDCEPARPRAGRGFPTDHPARAVDRLAEWLDAVRAEFSPAGPLERHLVDRLARACWGLGSLERSEPPGCQDHRASIRRAERALAAALADLRSAREILALGPQPAEGFQASTGRAAITPDPPSRDADRAGPDLPRFSAAQVATMIANGWTWDEILEENPGMTESAIAECLESLVERADGCLFA